MPRLTTVIVLGILTGSISPKRVRPPLNSGVVAREPLATGRLEARAIPTDGHQPLACGYRELRTCCVD
jgi:hypothetical protein